MAGMLAGVECARRRRLHQGGGSVDSPSGSRRSSFCLYTTSHESHLNASSVKRNGLNREAHGMALASVAREAKERLDERLRNQRTSKIDILYANSKSRQNGRESDDKKKNEGKQKEAFCLKKTWIKFGWKTSEQDVCAVCLEEFKTGSTLLNLPCTHRFHSGCVLPWLESNSHCPCCRRSFSFMGA